jgi:hypothetical protein
VALHARRSALHSPRSTLRAPLSALHSFAREWRDKHDRKWLEVDRLGGFCLLIKRAVLNQLGAAVNEWSDLGLFDTDMLSMKAREAGFRLAVCRDLFIHHFGTRTFAHGGGPGLIVAHFLQGQPTRGASIVVRATWHLNVFANGRAAVLQRRADRRSMRLSVCKPAIAG